MASLASSLHLPEAVGCCEDPVGIQDAPTTDVLIVVLDADLPWPRVHRGLHPTHHTRSLQALSTVWTHLGGMKRAVSFLWRGCLPRDPWSRALRNDMGRMGELTHTGSESFVGR